MNLRLKNILLFGDDYGIPALLQRVDHDLIAGIVAASIRPQSHIVLQQLAKEINVPFFIQPSFRNTCVYQSFLNNLNELQPDGLICHSYAMLIQEDILSLVSKRAFNLHFSLLPKNRGPNPVQWALIHGHQETGVTLHVMDGDFDCGAIVDQINEPINDQDTWVSLMERLKDTSEILLDRVVPKLISGDWEAQPQDETLAQVNPRISKNSFPILLSEMTDREIFNLIRAQIAPLKGAFLETAQGNIRFNEYMSLHKIKEKIKEYGSYKN